MESAVVAAHLNFSSRMLETAQHDIICIRWVHSLSSAILEYLPCH